MSVIKIQDLIPFDNPLEHAKRAASYKAVDENLKPDLHRLIGIGSGSTVVYVFERLRQYQAEYRDKVEFICIPTGFQSKNLIIANGLRLGSIEQYPVLDIAFDGADEVDHQLQLIKGGGACLMQEKLISASARTFVIVADSRKKSPKLLGTRWKKGVPIEVVPNAHVHVLNKLRALPGCQSALLRQGTPAKAGPVITDNNNFIIDANFGPISDPVGLHRTIKLMIGVVETGLFVDNIKLAYFGRSDGSVETVSK